MPREPECRVTQMRSSSPAHSSMKWLPPPSVPIWFTALVSSLPKERASLRACSDSKPSRISLNRRFSLPCRSMVGEWSLCAPFPTGTPRSMVRRSRPRSSGSRSGLRLVRTAVMPQPMSTPTAAGATAWCMAITDPTVAPFP